MTVKTLRPHQVVAVDMLRASLRAGNRRPVLQAPTGAGKTLIASHIFASALGKGKRCLFIVDAISLIDQTVRAFWQAGIRDVGVIQASHEMTDWRKPVQVASVQTLCRRGMPEADLVIIDEAHCSNQWLADIMASEAWAKVPFIGLTATPWAKGMGNVFDDLLQPTSMAALIEAGYLSRFRHYAPSHPDLKGVKLVAGDYHEGQLSDIMGDDVLVGDIVETWRKLSEHRATLVFGVDRAHAKKLNDRFNASGIASEYIDAFTDREEREAIRKRFESGWTKVVCNIGTLTKGVDWAVGCIVLARPTKSEMLYVQMVGRGLRVNEFPDCIILDHADNALRMGLVTDIDHDALCTKKKGEKSDAKPKEKLPKECPSCSFLKPAGVRECPVCKFVPEVGSDVAEGKGSLAEIVGGSTKPEAFEKRSFYAQLLGYAALHGKSGSYALAVFREKYGHWPHAKNGVKPINPTPETLSYITSRQIAYRARMAKQGRR